MEPRTIPLGNEGSVNPVLLIQAEDEPGPGGAKSSIHRESARLGPLLCECSLSKRSDSGGRSKRCHERGAACYRGRPTRGVHAGSLPEQTDGERARLRERRTRISRGPDARERGSRSRGKARTVTRWRSERFASDGRDIGDVIRELARRYGFDRAAADGGAAAAGGGECAKLKADDR